jgi:hypothetical protein
MTVEQDRQSDEEIQDESLNQTKDKIMEVHHHPDLHHDKKRVREYFLEFLMIFLAVSLGFLAENLREDYVEHSREKEFMKSMVEDLQMDTVQFTRIKMYRIDKLRLIDSLIIFYRDHTGGPVPASVYALDLKLFGHAGFFQNSGTLDQLKNSGGFRLIRHRNIVDLIGAYDQQIKRISLRDIYETNYSLDHNKLVQKLFDSRSLIKIYTDSSYLNKLENSDVLIKLNREYTDEYINNLFTFQYLIKTDMALQVSVQAKASKLLAIIKKEYNL